MNTSRNTFNTPQLSKFEDLDGNNYIVQSSLTHFESKATATNYSIKSVKKGVEHYKINGVMHEVGSRNFIIVSPGQEIEIWIDSPSEVEGICYFLEPGLVDQIRFANTRSVEDHLEQIDPVWEEVVDNFPIHVHHTFLNPYLQTAISEELDKQQIAEFLILMAEDLVDHQDHTKRQVNELEGIKAGSKMELYKRIQTGRQYIHDHFQESIKLKEVARAAGMSEYYYHRNFRHFFNKTPYQYHNWIRMEKAKLLLDTGKYSKTQVAYDCGFQDPKYFSKAYKKWLQS